MSYSVSRCITCMVGLQALSRLRNHHGRGSKPCPFCEEDSLADSVLKHVLARHSAEWVWWEPVMETG